MSPQQIIKMMVLRTSIRYLPATYNTTPYSASANPPTNNNYLYQQEANPVATAPIYPQYEKNEQNHAPYLQQQNNVESRILSQQQFMESQFVVQIVEVRNQLGQKM
jgi:hypothetical protein